MIYVSANSGKAIRKEKIVSLGYDFFMKTVK